MRNALLRSTIMMHTPKIQLRPSLRRIASYHRLDVPTHPPSAYMRILQALSKPLRMRSTGASVLAPHLFDVGEGPVKKLVSLVP